MYYELNLYVNNNLGKAFFKKLFMNENQMTCVTHCHKYDEVHIVFEGIEKFQIGKEEFDFYKGDTFVIPKGIYHCCKSASKDLKHFAFQITECSSELKKSRVSEMILVEFENSIFNFQKNAGEISSLFSFVCSAFFGKERLGKMTDTAGLIFEFISQNYTFDVKVSDLARELNYSVKQTERLVKKYTGMTFREALVEYRLIVADYLKKNFDFSDYEISLKVGYSSYSGFWKAKKKKSKM